MKPCQHERRGSEGGTEAERKADRKREREREFPAVLISAFHCFITPSSLSLFVLFSSSGWSSSRCPDLVQSHLFVDLC